MNRKSKDLIVSFLSNVPVDSNGYHMTGYTFYPYTPNNDKISEYFGHVDDDKQRSCTPRVGQHQVIGTFLIYAPK